MCVVKTKSKEGKEKKKAIAKCEVPTPAEPEESEVEDSLKTAKGIHRLSRSTTRRFLYFHNKTLSKIKLL